MSKAAWWGRYLLELVHEDPFEANGFDLTESGDLRVAGQEKRRSLLDRGRDMEGVDQFQVGLNPDVERAIDDGIRDIKEANVLPGKEAPKAFRSALVSQSHRFDEDLNSSEAGRNEGSRLSLNLPQPGQAKVLNFSNLRVDLRPRSRPRRQALQILDERGDAALACRAERDSDLDALDLARQGAVQAHGAVFEMSGDGEGFGHR